MKAKQTNKHTNINEYISFEVSYNRKNRECHALHKNPDLNDDDKQYNQMASRHNHVPWILSGSNMTHQYSLHAIRSQKEKKTQFLTPYFSVPFVWEPMLNN
jgi:hypothetical protein